MSKASILWSQLTTTRQRFMFLVGASLVIFPIALFIGFWVTVGWVISHFVIKYW